MTTNPRSIENEAKRVANEGEIFEREIVSVLDWLWSEDIGGHAEVEQRTRELLLDTIGCAIGGLRVPEVAALATQLAELDCGSFDYPGLSKPLSNSSFIVAFATASCWYEITEGLAAAHGRPGLHVIPAVLSYALAQKRTLGEVLAAIVAGYEIGGRLGHVYRMRPGMYADGTWGSFGAAAAISRLCGFSAATAMAGINHAACHIPFSIYYPITQGSVARNLTVAHGALAGSFAALAAHSGFGGPVGSLAESARVALDLQMTLPTTDMPVGRWTILDGYLKKYPATRHIHYGVTAAIRWHAEQGRPSSSVQRIRLQVYREAIMYCGNRAPTAQIAAQFSLTYGIAWALVHGDLGPDAYDPTGLANPIVRNLEAMIELVEDQQLTADEKRGCTLEVTSNGQKWSHTVTNVPGDRQTPLSRTEIIGKFSRLVEPVIAAERASRLVDHILHEPLSTPLNLSA